MEKRIVNLEVNDAGGWRRVSSFDIDELESGELEHAAQALLSLSASNKISARIITPGDHAPLVTWNKADGWREWRVAA